MIHPEPAENPENEEKHFDLPVKEQSNNDVQELEEEIDRSFPARIRNCFCGWRVDRNGKYQGIWKRLNDSHMLDFWVGEPELEDIDNIVSNLLLVNTLMLLMPYAMIPFFPPEVWADLNEKLLSCPVLYPNDDNLIKYDYGEMYEQFRNCCMFIMYAGLGCLAGGPLYFLMRPTKRRGEVALKRWWRNGGRYAVLILLCFTIATIISLLILSAWYFAYFTADMNYICHEMNSKNNAGSFFLISFILAMCVYLMI